jgi:hypothetical protein
MGVCRNVHIRPQGYCSRPERKPINVYIFSVATEWSLKMISARPDHRAACVIRKNWSNPFGVPAKSPVTKYSWILPSAGTSRTVPALTLKSVIEISAHRKRA